MFFARLPGESPCFSRVQITQSLILNRVGSILISLYSLRTKRERGSGGGLDVIRTSKAFESHIGATSCRLDLRQSYIGT